MTEKYKEYQILVELPFDNTVPFLIKELKRKKRTPYLIGFFIGLIFIFIVGFILFRHYVISENASFWNIFFGFLLSFPALVLLAPIHELIHGIGFRIKGAKKIKYGIMWRSFAAYAVADDFICNYKQYRFIALLPFFLLPIFLIPFLFFSIPVFWKILCYFTLLQHYLSCIGDILSLSYFYRFKNRDFVTWDNVEQGMSYYGARKEEAV